MTNMTGSKLSIFSHPGKITGYWITTRSFPYRGPYFVSGQYGCLFSRCRKYVINSLIHGHFHIDLVIIPRPILALDSVSGQYGGLGMITRPIWKCPCINLYVKHLCDHFIINHIVTFQWKTEKNVIIYMYRTRHHNDFPGIVWYKRNWI